MPRYYKRQFELFISNRDIPFIAATNDRQFKLTFSILLDFGAFNTYADITIYNLAWHTTAQSFIKGEYVGFRAGYEDTIDYIFKGKIVNIFRERQGGDTITRLICKGEALKPKQLIINKSFEGEVTIPELCRACAEVLNLPIIIDENDFPGSSPYISGYVLNGDPKYYLNKLAKAHNFNWVIESERLVIVGSTSFRNGSIVTVSASTGMVGVPEVTEIGADVVVKLNPSLRLGGRFEIKSETVQANFSGVYFRADIPETLGQGVYTIKKLQFDGDSYGDDWDTKITGFRN